MKKPKPTPPIIDPAPVVGPLDPPPALEGPNSGFTESLAEELWCLLGGGDRGLKLKTLPPMEALGWRHVAKELTTWLLGIGMVGPGGPVQPGEWNYAWVHDADAWEINDSSGGGVALILHDRDVPMMLAAPRMAEAIRTLLTRFQERGAIKRADLVALNEALPFTPSQPKESSDEPEDPRGT